MLPGRLGVHCWNICWESLFLLFLPVWFYIFLTVCWNLRASRSAMRLYKPFIHAVNSKDAGHLYLMCYIICGRFFHCRKVSCSSLSHIFPQLTLLKLHLPNSWLASLVRHSFFLFWADPPCIWPTTLVPHSYSISWIEAAMLYVLLTSNFYFEVMTMTTISPRIYRVINLGCHSCQGTWVVTNHYLVAWYILPAKHPLFLSWLGLGCRTIHTRIRHVSMSDTRPCPKLLYVFDNLDKWSKEPVLAKSTIVDTLLAIMLSRALVFGNLWKWWSGNNPKGRIYSVFWSLLVVTTREVVSWA